MSASKPQQGSDMGAGAPAQILSSLGLSLVQGIRVSGDPSHLPYVDRNVEFQGEPVRKSFFPRVGRDVQPLERIPDDADHEVTAATAQPSTPVHQPREPEQTGGTKTRKPQRGPRIRSHVNHTEQNRRQIQELEPHLQSLVLFHFGNSEALQVFALMRILWYLQQHPPIHICHIKRKNGDRRGMIMLVICLLCAPGPEAPSPFMHPNPLAKFAHHFRTFHCGIKNPFSCIVPLCDKSFALRHDMTRHIKTAHLEFNGMTGDVEDDIPDSVTASNDAGPSNTPHAFNGLSPIVARHNNPSSQVSTSGPNHQVNPYAPQTTPRTPLNQNWDTMNGGAGSAHGTRPSACPQAGYMMPGNAHWAVHPSSDRSSMSFHDVHREPDRGLSYMSASEADEAANYLNAHAQTTRFLSPSLLNGYPGGVPSGTHLQNQSHQQDSSTLVAQMTLMVDSNYRMNPAVENRVPQPRQNHIPSSSAQGSRQPTPSRTTARGVNQQWYDPNGTSRSARHVQALRHEMDYMSIESTGLPYPLAEQRYMQCGSQDLSTSSQTRHAGSSQQHRHQHPFQNRVDTTHNHNHYTPYPPQGHPQTLDMGSWTFTHASQAQRYPRTSQHSQTDRTRAKPPQHLGANVSLDRKTLKGGVERELPSWLGLIGLIVGVSEAFQIAILVFLGPPRERRRSILF